MMEAEVNQARFKKQFKQFLSALLNVPQPQGKQTNALCLAFRDLYRGRSELAMSVLNEQFGTHYSTRRFNEFLREATPIPTQMKEFMQAQVLLSRFDTVSAREIGQLLGIDLPGDDLL